ncbi:hypothetical protein J6590_021570 [Homalodisca vitripennis]|nr:hypothetical protein J6590_021570 [Homalodisca vitripennis]
MERSGPKRLVLPVSYYATNWPPNNNRDLFGSHGRISRRATLSSSVGWVADRGGQTRGHVIPPYLDSPTLMSCLTPLPRPLSPQLFCLPAFDCLEEVKCDTSVLRLSDTNVLHNSSTSASQSVPILSSSIQLFRGSQTRGHVIPPYLDSPTLMSCLTPLPRPLSPQLFCLRAFDCLEEVKPGDTSYLRTSTLRH